MTEGPWGGGGGGGVGGGDVALCVLRHLMMT